MGVKVVTSVWDHNAKGDVLKEYVYAAADEWNLQTEESRTFLQVVDSENDRVIALFDTFDHVEVIEDDE